MARNLKSIPENTVATTRRVRFKAQEKHLGKDPRRPAEDATVLDLGIYPCLPGIDESAK